MDNLQIRKLTQSDWELYKSIRLNSLQNSPDSFGSTYASEVMFTDSEWQSMLDPHSRTTDALPLIAESNVQMAGIAWGVIHETDLKTARVYQMWVSPSMRRHGIAKSLLDEIRMWALDRNCYQMALSVTTTNKAAIRFYLSYGFEPFDQVEQLRKGSVLKSHPMRLKFSSTA